MARLIERDELVKISSGISTDVEELSGYLKEIRALESAFAESWNDENPESKSKVCLANITNIGNIVQNAVSLSQGVAALYLEDTKIGGDI